MIFFVGKIKRLSKSENHLLSSHNLASYKSILFLVFKQEKNQIEIHKFI